MNQTSADHRSGARRPVRSAAAARDAGRARSSRSLAVALIALFTYRSLDSREGAVERVTHTLEVLQQLEGAAVERQGCRDRPARLPADRRRALPRAVHHARAALPGELRTLRQPDGGQPARSSSGSTRSSSSPPRRWRSWPRRSRCGAPANAAAALAIVRTDRGKDGDGSHPRPDRGDGERGAGLLASRQAGMAATPCALSSRITWGGSLLLLVLIAAAGVHDVARLPGARDAGLAPRRPDGA